MVRLLLAAVFLAAAPAWSQEVKLLEDTPADSAQPQAAAPGDMPQIIVPSEEKPAQAPAVKPAEPEKKPEAVKKAKTPAKKVKKAAKAQAVKPAVSASAAPAAAVTAPEAKPVTQQPASPAPASAPSVKAVAAKPAAAPAVKAVPAPAVKAQEKAVVPAAEAKKTEAKPAAADLDSLPELADVPPAEVKPAAAVEPAQKPAPKAEAPKPAAPKPEVKAVPETAAAQAPKAEPKPEVKAVVKTVPAPAPKTAPKPEVKAAPPAAPAQPAKPAGGAGFAVQKTHTVSGGDTLWDLSSKYYQDPYKWGKIYNANLGVVSNPDRIYPKSELVIPDITEEVKPEVRKPAAITESETVKEASLVSADVAQPAAQPAMPEPVEEKLPPSPAVKTAAAELSEALGNYDRNDLSEEMPEHQREWAAGVKVVPENWREDGVITARAKGDEESVEESLSMGGDVMEVSLSGSAGVKPGDYLNVYLKGAPAYDKAGKKIGREIQRAGLLEVTSVDGSRAKARVIDSVTAIAKGFIVKKK
jgi:nucleoid-associated protein YgaU